MSAAAISSASRASSAAASSGVRESTDVSGLGMLFPMVLAGTMSAAEVEVQGVERYLLSARVVVGLAAYAGVATESPFAHGRIVTCRGLRPDAPRRRHARRSVWPLQGR